VQNSDETVIRIIEKADEDGEKPRFPRTKGWSAAMADLDNLDLKILAIVRHNNQVTTENISRRIGLSPSAVQRRLQRLRKTKVIEFEAAAVSPQAVGQNLCVVVNIKLDREAPTLIKEFKEIVLPMPEVMQGYYVTGERDFVLIVTARDMDDYNGFLRRLAERFPHIASLNSSIVLERVKMGVSLPLSKAKSV
jgi:Lrp/AsnC family transcriptional regulator, leucine-responsive regulatory protein